MPARKWFKENLVIEAAKYQTRNAFNAGSLGAYLSASRLGILDEICAHMCSPLTFWTEEMLAAEAAKYATKAEFERFSLNAYQSARTRKLLPKICTHMKAQNRSWSDDDVRMEAVKYSNKVDFANNSPAAYSVAKKRGMIPEVCSHMDVLRKKEWSYSELFGLAQLYDTRADFRKNEKGTYSVALRNGWIDAVCAHMGRRQRSDEDAIYFIAEEKDVDTGYYLTKVGITSVNLGRQRIDEHFKTHFRNPTLLIHEPSSQARRIETSLLRRFCRRPDVSASDGSSELRLLTENELLNAVQMTKRLLQGEIS